jgi:hypothetical protein
MPFDVAELSREKTLWQTRLAARKIPSSRFNSSVVLGAGIAASAYAWLTRSSAEALAQRTRDLTDLGFNFTIGILGFLIAGFTVFATITKEELFRAMATIQSKAPGLSTLKYNLFAFMRVFFDYLLFASYCLTVKVLGPQGGPLAEFISILPNPGEIKSRVAKLAFILTVTLLVYVLVILKSFVYNIYQFVITTIQYSFVVRPPASGDLEYDGPEGPVPNLSIARETTTTLH